MQRPRHSLRVAQRASPPLTAGMACKLRALGLRERSCGVAMKSRLDAPVTRRHRRPRTTTVGPDLGRQLGFGAPTRQTGAVRISSLVAGALVTLRVGLTS